jgi:DNA repair exonuclease SbcCD nuclease subunit
MPDRRPLRVVHTSDVHLGAYSSVRDGYAAERHSLMQDAFIGVIDLANREQADVLLIAGDLFDNDRIHESVVTFAAEQIARFEGRTFLIPGNHDPMDPGKIYWRHDMEAVAPRLTILRDPAGQVVEPDDLDLVLWGRAYIDSDRNFRPLEGLPERRDGRWHIAMAHGHFVPDGANSIHSLLIHEAEVAAAAGHWDYMAFGHWEPHADVSAGGTTAIYSGAPMPLADANGRAGWAALVDFDESGVSWQLRRVDPRPLPDAT